MGLGILGYLTWDNVLWDLQYGDSLKFECRVTLGLGIRGRFRTNARMLWELDARTNARMLWELDAGTLRHLGYRAMGFRLLDYGTCNMAIGFECRDTLGLGIRGQVRT